MKGCYGHIKITPLAKVNDNQSFKVEAVTPITLSGEILSSIENTEKLILSATYLALEGLLEELKEQIHL